MFFKSKKWKEVAFDHGFSTTYTDTNSVKHHRISYELCENTNARRAIIDGYEYEETGIHIPRHKGIIYAVKSWLGGNKLFLTDDGGQLFDDDYELVNETGGNSKSKATYLEYAYKPVVGVDALLRMVSNDREFSELHENNKMIEDAFDNLKMCVKLCQDNNTD